MGTGGKTIDAIRTESGATVTIAERRGVPPLRYYAVTYSGTAEQTSKARELVGRVIEPFQAETNSPARRTFLLGIQLHCTADAADCECRALDYDRISKSMLGKSMISNIRCSLGLPANFTTPGSLKSCCKSLVNCDGLVKLDFEVELEEEECEHFQRKFKRLCANLWEGEAEHPQLISPAPLPGHTVSLTFVRRVGSAGTDQTLLLDRDTLRLSQDGWDLF